MRIFFARIISCVCELLCDLEANFRFWKFTRAQRKLVKYEKELEKIEADIKCIGQR